MSYILDALRKAERDRNLGKTPSLEDVTHAPIGAGTPDRSRRLMALAALVLGLLVLAVMLRPSAPSVDTGSPPAPVVMATPRPAAEVVIASPPPSPEPAAEQSPTTVDMLAENPTSESVSMDDLLDAPSDVALAPATPTAAPAEPATEPSEVPVQDVPTAAQDEPDSLSEPGEASAYKFLREMPSDYRAAFASLRVDVHVYDADPTRRWALIDGNKYVENATLPQGPRVVEITPEGIAFEFRGQTALLPLNR